jgi:hypothetical protein
MTKPPSVLHNWKEFEDALKEIAFIDAHIASHDATRRLKLIEVETAYKTATELKAKQREFLATELERFYLANRKEVEAKGRKSVEFQFGTAGMRIGQKMLKLLKGWNWTRVCEAVSDSLKFQDCLTHKPKLDKAAIKKLQPTPEELAAIGCKISQREEFFFEVFPEKAVNAA